MSAVITKIRSRGSFQSFIGWDDTYEVKLSRSKSRVGWMLVQAFVIVLHQLFLIYEHMLSIWGMEVSLGAEVHILHDTRLWIFITVSHISDIGSGVYVRLLDCMESFTKISGGT